MSEPDATESQRPRVSTCEPTLAALDSPRPAEPDEPPTLGGVRDALADAEAAFLAGRFADLSATLPALLRDADALVSASSGQGALLARQARSDARRLAGFSLGQAWLFDAAARAVDLAFNDADDPVTAMAAMNTKCFILLRQGLLYESGALAERFARDHEPRFTTAAPDELALWGRLMIGVSVAAARDNRPDQAREALRLARMAAAGLHRDTVTHSAPFGPVTVAMIHAENAMIQDRPDLTLSVGAQIIGRDFPVSLAYQRHRLDVANAYGATRQYGKATNVLLELRAIAPQWFAQQRYASDVLRAIIERRRVLSNDMRDLAEFLGVPV
jgi:hypothetical protein